MEKNSQDLSKSLQSIFERLDELEHRISRLEKRESRIPLHETIEEADDREISSVFPKILPGISGVKLFSIIGRTFLVLAGAFLLRVFTENETLIPVVGAIIGLLYALVWLYFADKSARKKETLSATFHGISSIIIAFPLIYEATTKLSIFTPIQSVFILFFITAVALSISSFRSLRSVYVIFILAALFTAFPLMFKTGKVEVFVIFIFILGLSSIGLKYFRNWHILPWVANFFVNIAFLFLISLASNPEKLVNRYSGLSVSFALTLIIIYVIIYLSGFISATLILKRQISIFGMLQSIIALIIGLTGSISITHGSGFGYYVLGGFAAFFALTFYLIAFLLLKPEAKINFYYYTWMAFILSLAGIWILCSKNIQIVSFGILSILGIYLTKFFERYNTLSIQSALYAILAAWLSGLIRLSVQSFISDENIFLVFPPMAIVVLVLCFIVYILHIASDKYSHDTIQASSFTMLTLTLLVISGFIISVLTRFFAYQDETLQLNILALIRTIVISVSVIIISWLSNKKRLYELSYLVYPILILAGIKLLIEDLRTGNPITLFLSFMFFGFALIAAPKLKRKKAENKKS